MDAVETAGDRLTPRGPGRRGLLFGVTSSASARAFLVGQIAHLSNFGPSTLICDGPTTAAFAEEERARFRHVSMRRAPSPARDLIALWKLMWIYQREKPYASIVGTPKMGLLGGLAAWSTRVPVRVYVMHGLRLEGARGLGRLVLRLAERVTCLVATNVVAVSPSLAGTAIDMRLADGDKISVLGHGSPNGVDTVHFRPPSTDERREARARWEVPDDAEVLAFVGRLTVDKGIRELIAAWGLLAAGHPRTHLLVAGVWELPGHVALALRDLARDPRVHLLGQMPPRPVYWAADLLVLPTYREGLGLVVLEAAACEVPAVTTKVTGAVDTVVDRLTGYLVAPRDVSALAAALTEALDTDAHRRLGPAARARTVDLYARPLVWSHWQAALRRWGVPEVCPGPATSASPVATPGGLGPSVVAGPLHGEGAPYHAASAGLEARPREPGSSA